MQSANGSAARAIGGPAPEFTSFIGRQPEVRRVRELLSASRLVTVTGVGGVGKTRLGLRVARQTQRAFTDGVWHVDLTGLRDPSLLEYAVAQAWGIGNATGTPTARLLTNYVAERELLLLLDGCDHLIDACRELTASLLRAGPRLRVLCTSRERLGVAGEALFELSPLPVPPADGQVSTLDDSAYAGLTLFVERAEAATAGFALTPENWPVVAEICGRLDGLPLAIELAATQLRTMSVRQLAAGLVDRFELLSVRRVVPAHHRTLWDAFEWSFTLCTPAEQALWTRLAVFSGSFDLDAATAVCADEGLPAGSVLDVLTGLIDKSVVLRAELEGPARYRLLDSVCEYGLSRQRAIVGMNTAMSRCHADWYVRRAEEFDAAWFGPDQPRLGAAMRADMDNVRAALGWLLTTGSAAQAALRLAGALRCYWTACGSLSEGRYWLTRALAADPAATAERAAALSAQVRVLITQGDHAAGAPYATEGVDVARTLGDPSLVARAAADFGMHLLMFGERLPDAQSILEEAQAGYERMDGTDSTSLGLTRLAIAVTTLYRGDCERAEQLATACLALCDAHGEQWHRCHVLVAFALIALVKQDSERAAMYLRETLPIKSTLGDTVGIARALELLGRAAAIGTDHERAGRLTGAAHRIWYELGRTEQGPRPYRQQMNQASEDARGALGQRAYEVAYQQGYELSMSDAIALALGTQQVLPPRPDPPIDSPLTRRERQVAELIADGLSNKQVATRLVVSQRTVESYVENILGKLGVSSRTQVATWMAQHHDD